MTLTLFIRKTYKVIIVFCLIVFFFFVYSTYLIDHSLVNLMLALNSVAHAQTVGDLKKIEPFLKASMFKEISKKNIVSKTILYLGVAESIALNAKVIDQGLQVKFYLNSIIKEKQKERGVFLGFFDRLNSSIFKSPLKTEDKQLKSKVKVLLAKIGYIKEKGALQEAYYDLGNTYTELSDFSKAEGAFIQCYDVYPESQIAIKAKFNLAWAYKCSGDYEKFMYYLKELSKQTTDSAVVMVCQYEIANTLYKTGRYKEARDYYSKLAEEYSSDFSFSALALLQAGSISLYDLQENKAAQKYFTELEAMTSKEGVRSEEADDVRQLVRQMVQQIRNYTAKEFRVAGFALLIEKKYLEATQNFLKAVEIDPLDSRSFIGLGLGYYWLGQREEALNNAKIALSNSGSDELPVINAMFIYINFSDLDTAIKLGEDFLTKNKKPSHRPKLYYNLGCAYFLKDRISEATDYFDLAIRSDNDFSFSYNNLGCALWSVKNYAEAIKKFRHAAALDPSYIEPCFNLGYIYLQLHRYEDSYKQFKKVLDLQPDHKEAQKYIQRLISILKYTP